jgi:hypothetical protein
MLSTLLSDLFSITWSSAILYIGRCVTTKYDSSKKYVSKENSRGGINYERRREKAHESKERETRRK